MSYRKHEHIYRSPLFPDKTERGYDAPILHLENIEDEDLEIAMQILGAFEGCGIAFGAVFYNEVQDNINVHTYNMNDDESQEVFEEVCAIEELKDYEIKLY